MEKYENFIFFVYLSVLNTFASYYVFFFEIGNLGGGFCFKF